MPKKRHCCKICKSMLPSFDDERNNITKCEVEDCRISWKWTAKDKTLTAVDWPGKRKPDTCGCDSCKSLGR